MWSGLCSLDIAFHQVAQHWHRQSHEKRRTCKISNSRNRKYIFYLGWIFLFFWILLLITHIWKMSPVLCAGLPDTVIASIATGWEQTRVGCSICRRSTVSKSPFPDGLSKLNHCVLQPSIQLNTFGRWPYIYRVIYLVRASYFYLQVWATNDYCKWKYMERTLGLLSSKLVFLQPALAVPAGQSRHCKFLVRLGRLTSLDPTVLRCSVT